MVDLAVVVEGLRFPEGPIAMPDGTVLLVEMLWPRLTRVHLDGRTETVAEVPGGPNGAALGPDGAVYVCNNGGCFTPVEHNGQFLPGPFDPDRYAGGSIQRVDLVTGEVTDVYTECDGHPLRAPNDLVFDHHGGMWFTDHGIRDGRSSDRTAIYYGAADGSRIVEAAFPVDAPNGIALAPGDERVYWSETFTGRVYQRTVVGPGELAPVGMMDASSCLAGLPGLQFLDSMAVDSAGNVCVATVLSGGITVISPEGELVDFLATGDPMTTNICFGGEDLRTAYITGGSRGSLWATTWPRPGLALAH